VPAPSAAPVPAPVPSPVAAPVPLPTAAKEEAAADLSDFLAMPNPVPVPAPTPATAADMSSLLDLLNANKETGARYLAEASGGITQEEAEYQAKVEAAHVGVMFEYVYQTGFCLMAFVLNEMGGRHIQRAVLFFVIATYALATAGITMWLKPVGYVEAKAGFETTLSTGLLGLMLMMLFMDCCCNGKKESSGTSRRKSKKSSFSTKKSKKGSKGDYEAAPDEDPDEESGSFGQYASDD